MAVSEIFVFEFGATGEVGCPLILAPEQRFFFLDRSGSWPRNLSQLILGLTRETLAPLTLASVTETNIWCKRWL
jgi:hypothetical protein